MLPQNRQDGGCIKRKDGFLIADKPSIAVLPFVNMSDDPCKSSSATASPRDHHRSFQESIPLVIARTSTFTYKGNPVKVKQVCEELGVRYVLEGSVRRSGEKVRITAQLIDGMTGYHLWAERFDRDLEEIFTVQDEIAFKIMKTVHVKLQTGGHAGETGKGTRNLEAFLKAWSPRALLSFHQRRKCLSTEAL